MYNAASLSAEVEAMAIIPQPFLFRWDAVDAKSDLDRLNLVIKYLPDEDVIRELIKRRGNGRNDFPIRPMWNALLAAVVFQHRSAASLIRELTRNGELREICGFDPLLGAAAVPDEHNMSRFVGNVVELEPRIHQMFDRLVDRATTLLPTLGQALAFDGKALPSYSTGRKNRKSGQTSDPDAAHGVKTYQGVHEDGTPWQKMMHWFGYQLHLIVDSHHELPVAYEVMPANASEVTRLLPMVEELAEKHPELIARTEELAADRGLDSAEVNRRLLQDHDIRPIIDNRALWRQEKAEPGYDPRKPITRPLSPERADTIVYTEKGDVLCVCPTTGETRDMAFMGYENDRESVKYRCPAAAYGYGCAGRAECHALAPGHPGAFGRIVRVPLETDYRIFVPTPRSSPSFERAYNKRTAAERFNSRIDNVLGFEDHTIRGLQKMRARMGLALVIALALAVGHLMEGRPEQIRSLVGPMARARPALKRAA